jgi:hypothetical protein
LPQNNSENQQGTENKRSEDHEDGAKCRCAHEFRQAHGE